MKTAVEFLDDIQDELRSLSLEEWLEFLQDMQGNLEMRIYNVRKDIENQDKL